MVHANIKCFLLRERSVRTKIVAKWIFRVNYSYYNCGKSQKLKKTKFYLVAYDLTIF